MLRWALIFLLIGLVAGILAFSGIGGASFVVARLLFFSFIGIFFVLAVAGLSVTRHSDGPHPRPHP